MFLHVFTRISMVYFWYIWYLLHVTVYIAKRMWHSGTTSRALLLLKRGFMGFLSSRNCSSHMHHAAQKLQRCQAARICDAFRLVQYVLPGKCVEILIVLT